VHLIKVIQWLRYEKKPIGVNCNAQMPNNQIKDLCPISEVSTQLLKTEMQRLNLSTRAYDRILIVSRTIADLEQSEDIKIKHLTEAWAG
jgi:magnesium chelatase family protein